MALRINDTAPDFTANTSTGTIKFHDWIGDGWAMLFSHPKDFTPVCATELGYVAKINGEFAKRGCKVIGLSVDRVDDHLKWAADIEDLAGTKLNFPIIADEDLEVAKLYDMLPADEGGSSEGRTAADNQTVRSVFLIAPDKKIKMSLTYPMSTGRNFDELLRVLDSCQLTAKHKVATPANWAKGEDVIILPSVNNDAAKELFPDGWETVKPYLRKVKDPSS
ncbi:MAG: peroxiredoxin [Chloroflexi bacterium]|nr:peroxiredoxin [Chloroflexota bacterium]MCH7656528.1 peroxiredoxin [Chloroflexota bacterium]MCI0816145.1 peroxiredoxin [Chloroflexota bacterium]